MVAGDQHVEGLAAALRGLAGKVGVTLGVLKVDALRAESEAERAVLGLVEEVRPKVVLVSGAGERDRLYELAMKLLVGARVAGSRLVWLRPAHDRELAGEIRRQLDRVGVPSFHSEVLDLQFGPDGRTPTAAGYAGWAGALWRWLR